MARDRRRSPRLESLEGRQLLAARIAHAARPPAPLVLNGTFNGQVSSYLDTPGPPEIMSEVFSGRTRSTGAAKAVIYDIIDPTTGALLGGQVALSNARGSIHLVFGPSDVVSTQMVGTLTTQVLHYTVASGTGAYAGVGSGPAVNVVNVPAGSFASGGSGTITLLQNTGKSATLVINSSAT